MTCQRSNWCIAPPALAVGAGLAVCSVIAAAGCTQQPPTVGDALLARASGAHEVPSSAAGAPIVEVLPDQPTTIPDAPVIRLAIDRKAPWGQVRAVLAQLRARKQEPVFLVSWRQSVKAFQLSDPIDPTEETSFELLAFEDGKSCVSPRGTDRAKCVKTRLPTFTSIDVAGTRQIVREAVNVYGLTDIDVDIRGELSWADVVRTVDAARTCCRRLTVSVHLDH